MTPFACKKLLSVRSPFSKMLLVLNRLQSDILLKHDINNIALKKAFIPHLSIEVEVFCLVLDKNQNQKNKKQPKRYF